MKRNHATLLYVLVTVGILLVLLLCALVRRCLGCDSRDCCACFREDDEDSLAAHDSAEMQGVASRLEAAAIEMTPSSGMGGLTSEWASPLGLVEAGDHRHRVAAASRDHRINYPELQWHAAKKSASCLES